MARINQNKDPIRWLLKHNGQGPSAATAATIKGEPDDGMAVGQSLGPGGRQLRTVDKGSDTLFGDDDDEGGARKRKDNGAEGSYDEMLFAAPNIQNVLTHLNFAKTGMQTGDVQCMVDVNVTRFHNELVGPLMTGLMGEAPFDLTPELAPLVIGPLLLLLNLIQFPGGIGQQIRPVVRWLTGHRFDMHDRGLKEVQITDVRA